MSTKNKNSQKTVTDKLADLTQYTGFALMTLAASISMLELPDNPNRRAIVPNQPTFAFAFNSDVQAANPLRREREESAPHYISYSEVQRTPGRSGKY